MSTLCEAKNLRIPNLVHSVSNVCCYNFIDQNIRQFSTEPQQVQKQQMHTVIKEKLKPLPCFVLKVLQEFLVKIDRSS